MLVPSLISLLLAVSSAASSSPPNPNRPANAAADGRFAHATQYDATTASRSPRDAHRSMQEKEERYEILPSAAILARLQRLAKDYPAFVTLTTAQEWFGMPRAGKDSDCPFDGNYPVRGKGCNNYILILQDKEAYPEDPDVQLAHHADYFLDLEQGWFKDGEGKMADKSGWKYVPDVFLSGAVHGNERVGPTSLLEMAELSAEAAYCESLPRMRHKPPEPDDDAATASSEETAKWKKELADAQACRKSLDDKGIPARHRRWLARLVSTRRTVIIPTANALGYSRDQREEEGIDPNRDFPFDIEPKDKAKCMQTTAGRSINELFRSHLFPIGLTFHGGMEVIGYEWGAPTYLNKDAPDALAQKNIAGAYSRYANGFQGHRAYDFGTMNDKVYYVRGGMEDWAFAGSWDPDRVVQCDPKTFGGYPAEKTTYNNSTLRAFNMLVETSSPKTPERNDLGKRNNPLDSTSGGENGHIARNIRLALLAMDMVEPYVSIREVGGLELEDDVVPGVNPRRYGGKGYFDNSAVVWTPGANKESDHDGGGGRKAESDPAASAKISWTVGGAYEVDETELIFGPWDALPLDLADAKDGAYPSAQTMQKIHGEFVTVSPSNTDEQGSPAGRTRWHSQGANPVSSSGGVDPVFEAVIDASAYPPGTNLAIVARAKVDKGWLQASKNVAPSGLGPASHLVNARGNPDYYATNAGKVVRGREDGWWYSAPVALVVGAGGGPEEAQLLDEAEANHAPVSFESQGAGGKGSNVVRAVHVNARIGYLPHVMEAVARPGEDGGHAFGGAPTSRSLPFLLVALAASIFLLLVAVGLLRRRRRRRLYARQRLAAEEEDGFSVGSYRDDPAEEEDDVEVASLGSARLDARHDEVAEEAKAK